MSAQKRRYAENLRFGELCIREGLITEQQLRQALAEQKKKGGLLGAILIRMGHLNRQDLNVVFERQLEFETFEKERVTFQAILKLRWFLYLAIPLVTVLGHMLKVGQYAIDPMKAVFLYATANGINAISMIATRPDVYRPGFKYFMLGTEAVVFSFFIHMTGGPQSGLFSIYMFGILEAAATFGFLAGMGIAVLSMLGYALVFATAFFAAPTPRQATLEMFFRVTLFLSASALISWYSGGVIARILQIRSTMARAEKGDLGIRANASRKDEIGWLARSFNNMTDGISNIFFKVRELSESVAATSEQLSAATQEVSASAVEVSKTAQNIAQSAGGQARRIQDMLSRTGEYAKTTVEISDSAVSTSSLTEDVNRLAIENKNSIETSVRMLLDIQNVVNVSVGSINHLEKSSKAIGTFLNLIKGIAEQTNLLALNAAIEAARAGKHGLGFGVVADEIRKLAEESALETKKIESIVEDIQTQISGVASSMQQGADKVKNIGAISEQTIGSLEEIIGGVGSSSRKVQEIADSIRAQNSTLHEMVNSLEDINRLAEESSSGTEEVAASTEQQTAATEQMAASCTTLAENANHLTQLVEEYVLTSSASKRIYVDGVKPS